MKGSIVSAVLLLLLFGCTNESPDTRAEPALLVSAHADSSDTLTQLLVARQRALFALLASKDRTGLSDYLEANYSWRYSSLVYAKRVTATRPRAPADSVVVGERLTRPAVPYLTVISGFVPESLNPMPTEFTVDLNRNVATVTATNKTNAIRLVTSWRSTPSGWRAIETRESLIGSALAPGPRQNGWSVGPPQIGSIWPHLQRLYLSASLGPQLPRGSDRFPYERQLALNGTGHP